MKNLIDELIRLEQQQQTTGRKNYKRLSEIQNKMLIESAKIQQQSIQQTDKALHQADCFMSAYEAMERRAVSLEAANYQLYSIMQSGKLEQIEHHC